MPYAARFYTPVIADKAAALAVPAVPFAERAPELWLYFGGFAGRQSVRIPAGWILHELSFPGAWFESSFRGEADALAQPAAAGCPQALNGGPTE